MDVLLRDYGRFERKGETFSPSKALFSSCCYTSRYRFYYRLKKKSCDFVHCPLSGNDGAALWFLPFQPVSCSFSALLTNVCIPTVRSFSGVNAKVSSTCEEDLILLAVANECVSRPYSSRASSQFEFQFTSISFRIKQSEGFLYWTTTALCLQNFFLFYYTLFSPVKLLSLKFESNAISHTLLAPASPRIEVFLCLFLYWNL